VPQPLCRDRQEPAVGRNSHDRLRDTERDDLRVCDPSRSVPCSLGQEIVGRDEHGREQQVEVGVHRGPLGSAMPMSTADFDPAALYSSKTAINGHRRGMPTSTYDGTGGIVFRDNLAGLNLTEVPEVLIECGNMRNATDAALLTSTTFQQQAATALTQAIERFLSRL
jgi:hypothetical protein